MAAINHNISDQELEDAYNAIYAIQKEKGHSDTAAHFTAWTLRYAVFRNLITLDSLKKSIVANARKVFAH